MVYLIKMRFQNNEFVVYNDYLIQNKYAENTIKTYMIYAYDLISWDITQDNLKNIYNIRGHKVFLAFLKSINRCFKLRLDFEDIKPRGRQLKKIEEVQYLTKDQVLDIFVAIYEDNRLLACIIALMWENGLRISEVLNLRKKNFFNDYRSVKFVGKGNKEALDTLSDEVRLLVIQIIELNKFKANDFIFRYSRVQHLRQKVWYDIRNYSDKLGIRTNTGDKPTPHVFRHSFGTYLGKIGFNLREIQTMLRHSKLETAKHYVSVGQREELENKKRERW